MESVEWEMGRGLQEEGWGEHGARNKRQAAGHRQQAAGSRQQVACSMAQGRLRNARCPGPTPLGRAAHGPWPVGRWLLAVGCWLLATGDERG
jgi:uncharacterized protein YjbJ (UPF0337 family)